MPAPWSSRPWSVAEGSEGVDGVGGAEARQRPDGCGMGGQGAWVDVSASVEQPLVGMGGQGVSALVERRLPAAQATPPRRSSSVDTPVFTAPARLSAPVERPLVALPATPAARLQLYAKPAALGAILLHEAQSRVSVSSSLTLADWNASPGLRDGHWKCLNCSTISTDGDACCIGCGARRDVFARGMTNEGVTAIQANAYRTAYGRGLRLLQDREPLHVAGEALAIGATNYVSDVLDTINKFRNSY